MTFETIIKDVSPQGLGVGQHPDGRIFFIPGTCPNDKIVAEILSYKKKYGFGKLIKVLEPSPDRIASVCPHHGLGPQTCGGCPWMFINYPAQLKFKQKIVETQLSRAQLNLHPSVIQPLWGSEKIFAYRNRAQFKTDGQILGYVETGTNNLVKIDNCIILSEKNQHQLLKIKNDLPLINKEFPRQENKTNHLWHTIEIDDQADELFRLNKRFPFRQGNDLQNTKMRGWLESKIKRHQNYSVALELFCGSGNFTEIIAKHPYKKIYAIDVVGESLDNLKNKNWPHVHIIEANLFDQQTYKKIQQTCAETETLVLDPPRDGFENINLFLGRFNHIKNVYFISCEITHFVRDAKKMIELGYTLIEIQPLDQFPHTPHIELLAHFVKN